MRNSIALLAVICVILSVMVTSIAFSRPWRPALLPDNGENFRCGTCHINPAGGGPRNRFGEDFQRIGIPAGDKYTDELAKLDSDGDGFTNQEEFDAKPTTHPGDANSHPREKPNSVKPKGKLITTWGRMKAR